MNIGYIRVSSKDQNERRQIEALQSKVDKIYLDKLSGKNTNRPQLKEMLEYMRDGDIVYIVSISRLARNTKDFLELMEVFQKKNVSIVCLKEPIDTTTPQGKMIYTIFAAMYEMERENIRGRQKEGIAAAHKQGVKFGRKKIESDQFKTVYTKWKGGEITAVKAMEMLNMKRNTFYRRVKELES